MLHSDLSLKAREFHPASDVEGREKFEIYVDIKLVKKKINCNLMIYKLSTYMQLAINAPQELCFTIL